jgi:putative protease
MPLLAAAKRPLTTATLQAQLGRLGETDFALGEVVNELKGDVIVPVSELNRLRRELVGKLQEPEARSQKPEMLPPVLASLLPKRGSVPVAAPQLVVLCRTMEQVAAAVACGVETVYLDFEDPRRYAEAVRAGAEMFLATPRIVKPGEEGLLKAAMQAAGVLVRNFSGLVFPGRKVGDFSLNVANPLAAQVLIDAGLERVTVSYDLNAEQVVALLQAAPPAWFEVVIHQHLPMFHMDHCVFAAFLSNGTDHTNCGRPCDRHRVELRDRVGAEHLVHADVGCRNTVYHARAQSGAAFVGEFLAAGARTFRVELLDEDAAQARTVIQTYRQLLAGKTTPAEVSRRLRTVDQLGVTSGTLTVLG